MAIEVQVYKEIRSYKEKYIGGLTGRQLVSLGASITVALAVGVANYFFWKIPIDSLGPLIVVSVIPIFGIGWFEKNGFPFEKWVKINIDYRFKKQVRPYVTETLEVLPSDKKEKRRQRRINECLNDDGTKESLSFTAKAKKEKRKATT